MKNPVDALWDVADAVGRAIGYGMTLAAEILCPRDHLAEERLRSWESAAVAVEDEICDEAEADEDYLFTTTWAEYNATKSDEFESVSPCRRSFPCGPPAFCGCSQDYEARRSDSSAAVSAAADPSPADVQAVGGEGSGGASDILQSAPPEQPTGNTFDARDENALALLKLDPDAYFEITRLCLPKQVRHNAIVRALDAAEAKARLDRNPETKAKLLAAEADIDTAVEIDPGAVSTPAPGERTYKDCRECGEPVLVGSPYPCTNCLLGIASDERVFKHLKIARQFLFHHHPPNTVMAMEKLFHAVLALAQK